MTILKVKGIQTVDLNVESVILLPSFTGNPYLTIALDPKSGKSAYVLALIEVVERKTALNLRRVCATWFLNSLSYDGIIPERITRAALTKRDIVNNLIQCANQRVLKVDSHHFLTGEGIREWAIKTLNPAPQEFYVK